MSFLCVIQREMLFQNADWFLYTVFFRLPRLIKAVKRDD